MTGSNTTLSANRFVKNKKKSVELHLSSIIIIERIQIGVKKYLILRMRINEQKENDNATQLSPKAKNMQ